jgi:cupin fold WbuC family metalloprotein
VTGEKIAVFYSSDCIAEVGDAWLKKLKLHAKEADQKRARLCLHGSPEDPLHEMIIVFHRDTVVRPHRHRNKSESFHLMFGELDIILFDDDGRPDRVVSMGERALGKTQVYRLSAPIWHSVVVRSEYAAIHEVTNGPFIATESEFAPWAPVEPELVRSFNAKARQSLV